MEKQSRLRKPLSLLMAVAITLGMMGVTKFAPIQVSAAGADVWDGTTDTTWYDNANPQNDYEIETAGQLAGLAELVEQGNTFNSVTFKLLSDIDLDGRLWKPIGNTGNTLDPSKAFQGVFDGNDKTIKNIYINNPTNDNQGLFGYIYNGTVKNLTVEDVDITAQSRVGGIVGRIEGNNGSVLIDNCSATGTITGYNHVGVLAGIMYCANSGSGELKNSQTHGTVTGTYRTGGVAGTLNSTGGISIVMSECHTDVSVYSTADVESTWIGGVVGALNANTGEINVKGSSSSGDVYGNSFLNSGVLGGIIGDAYTNAGTIDIEDCLFTGNVTGQGSVGGIIGKAKDEDTDEITTTIARCVSTGNITGTLSFAGGIAGDAMGTGIINSFATGNITGRNSVGGLVGSLVGNITNCYFTGNVIGYNMVGGIAGVMSSPYDFVLDEIVRYSNITNCYAAGTVTAMCDDADGFAGGIVGFLANTSGKVKNSVVLCEKITGYGIIGRIIGESYTRFTGPDVDPENNYVLETMLIGETGNETTINDASPYPENDKNGKGLNAAAIADPTTYSGTLGWNLDSVWLMENGKLILRDLAADYSAVDTAIAKIPTDLSLYTEATANAVTAAKDAVVRGKNITEQTSVDGYATAIENAITALVYKGANYSAVDTAIAKIPVDLSLYTEATANAVTAAKNAVVWGKNITEQTTVDGYATAIENAIAALVKKPTDSPTADTGDNSNMFLWFLLGSASLTVLGLTVRKRKYAIKR